VGIMERPYSTVRILAENCSVKAILASSLTTDNKNTLKEKIRFILGCVHSSAMSNPNRLLSQNICHYLNQGRTLNDILMSAAHSMAYFHLSKLNLV